MTKILMVCMGNICRSPMAQAVTLHLVKQSGLARQIQIDSAGTHAARGGQAADPRAKAALSTRGYPVGKNKSRLVDEQDFMRYDLILAMDQANLNDLRRICPNESTHKLRLFLEFAGDVDTRDIPDPYYGNVQGFERVLDLCETGARGLVSYCQTVPG
jgi:protein-tyrosine phosphatase